MKVLVSGASGLIGSALCRSLEQDAHSVHRMVRRPPRADTEVEWNPRSGPSDPAALSGFDAVVHLAGENIAKGRWTAAKMARIRDSRTEGTGALCEALAGASVKPRVLVAASAVGFYGDRGDELLDETSSPGTGFLADVCREWESATTPAVTAGVRVVNLRIGVVLTPEGGALAAMLLPFKLGAGGKIGSGRQYMSWISHADVVRAMRHALETESLAGPVNAVAPNAVTNLEYTKALGGALSRPTFVPVPAFAARLAFGKMADELLLSSTRVVPARLLESGFQFRDTEIGATLSRLLRE